MALIAKQNNTTLNKTEENRRIHFYQFSMINTNVMIIDNHKGGNKKVEKLKTKTGQEKNILWIIKTGNREISNDGLNNQVFKKYKLKNTINIFLFTCCFVNCFESFNDKI